MNVQEMQSELTEESLQASNCAKDDCCSMAEDGSTICRVPSPAEMVKVESSTCGCDSSDSGCGCSSASPIQLTTLTQDTEHRNTWQKIRGGVMLTIACIASPCCSVLLVPIVLTLLAGTPVAVWISHNLGLVYGGLTLLSIVSFVLAFRWLTKSNRRTGLTKNPPVSTSALPKNEISSQTL